MTGKDNWIVCCDLGGVLINNDFHRLADYYLSKFNISKKQISKAFSYLHKADISSDNTHEILNKLNIDPKVWESFVKDLWNSEKINQSLYEQLIFLKKKYKSKLFATTNNTSYVTNILEKHGLGSFFDKVIVSYEVGFLKHQKEYWEVVRRSSELLGHDPSKLYVIEDDPKVINLLKKLNIKHILYDNNDKDIIKSLFL
jgi:FMN phosphatase YigB (HAD superfamily)